jgi:hypothetical protein
MTNPDLEIESMLRRAPRPVPPPGLKEALLSGASRIVRSGLVDQHSPSRQPSVDAGTSWSRVDNRSWLRRWWPALGPAAVSVACAVAITVQRLEVQDLNQSRATLSAAMPNASTESASGQRAQAVSTTMVHPATQEEEIARLSDLARQLSADIARLEQVSKDNAKLRAQISEAQANTISSDEIDAMKKAQERAMSVQCINNLKQVGLAVRVWALDNNDIFPTNFLCMSNELSTPKILVCPADTNRMVAPNFGSYTDANCSYDLFFGSDREPTQVLSRCPIHGHIGLCDGSVQSEIAKKHPDWLVERDGKLYLENVGGRPPGSGKQ